MTTTSTNQPSASQPAQQVAGWADRGTTSVPAQVGAIAGTNLRSWSRNPGIIVQSLFFPAFMLLMFQLVFGKSIGQLGGGDSVFGYTALVALVGALYGSVATTLLLVEERESGLLSRMWTLPVNRYSFVAGRIAAEALRTGLSTIILFGVGIALGLRFEQGPLGALAALAVTMVFAVCVSVPVMALALVSNGLQAVQTLGGVFLFLLFFNSGFAPVTEFPGWLQPVVRAQPLSPAIEAIRGLTEGGPVLWPVAGVLAWAVVLIGMFGPLAVRRYHRAAEGR